MMGRRQVERLNITIECIAYWVRLALMSLEVLVLISLVVIM